MRLGIVSPWTPIPGPQRIATSALVRALFIGKSRGLTSRQPRPTFRGDCGNRGARVFELDESVEGLYADTRLVFARDLGIDMSVPKQPLGAPLEFPRGVR